jgi:hypothetical protein
MKFILTKELTDKINNKFKDLGLSKPFSNMVIESIVLIILWTLEETGNIEGVMSKKVNYE